MNIRDALDQVDALKPNQYDEQQKIYWLSQVDQRIYNDVVLRHEMDESMPATFGGYPPDVDQDTRLLAGAPFDALYRWWLEAMIDLGNGELGKYQNSMLLFNSAWNDFAKDYRRKHMPLGQQKIGFTAGGRKPCGATGDAMDRLTQATQDANKAAFSAQLIAQTLREKLDSGELKGEKGDTGPAGATGPAGPQGPKGDPGESGGGSVTAESIAAALGYTPASGTTFQLIEEVTLQEDTTSFIRSQKPDGTAYNLKSIIIEIDASNVSSRASVWAWVRLNSTKPYDEWRYIANGEIFSASNAASYFVWRSTSDGSIDTWFAAAENNEVTGKTSLSETRFIPSNVLRMDVQIIDFMLYTTDGVIPAGTKISIYGVTRDA